jgi:A/G-specific adenine glycosylase
MLSDNKQEKELSVNLSKRQIKHFQKRALDYYKTHERTFRWRQTRDPYEILVSEFMLQQTQTSRVVSYFDRFIGSFSTFKSLAEAEVADLLKHWQGLGYNRRALNLQRTAQQVQDNFQGTLPVETGDLLSLPGVGVYTAQALRAFVFGLPVVLIETNVRAVFIHHFFPNKEKVHDREITPLVEKTLWHTDPRVWYYALMDYGVHIKSKQKGIGKQSAHYVRQSPFAGSHRQVRGAILRELAKHERLSVSALHKKLSHSPEKVQQCIEELGREGFLVREKNEVYLGS